MKQASGASGKTFRKDLNGLRAIAVISVLLFHFSIPPFDGGFVGVDIFFVISGFLMTEIISRGLMRESFVLSEFYLRRLARILPALALLTGLLLFIGTAILLPEAYNRLTHEITFALSFLINFKFSQSTGYFGENPNTSWLLHCWSLAVEFQFYIIFPLFLWAAWRMGRRPAIVISLVLIAATSIFYSLFETSRDQMSAFYLLPARAWEFAIGGLIVLAPAPNKRLSRHIAHVGLIAILAAVLTYNPTMLYPSMWPLLPVMGTALIVWANTENALFENPASQFLGSISYSLYLWHWPIITIARYSGVTNTPMNTLGLLALAICCGWLSYTTIENRFRLENWKLHRRKIAGLFLSVFFVAGLGSLLATNAAKPYRIPNTMQELVDRSTHTFQYRDNVCFLSPTQHFSDLAPECTSVSNPAKPMLLIWGDSHAAHLYPGISKQSWSSKFNIAQITASSCSPIHQEIVDGRPFCPDIQLKALALIKQLRPHTVLLAGLSLGLSGDLNDARPDAEKAPELTELITSLRTSGIEEVYVMGPIPKWRLALPQLIYIRNRLHPSHIHERERIVNASTLPSEDRVLRAVTQTAGGKYISIMDAACQSTKCLALVPTATEKAITQFDTEHLTAQGSEWLASVAIGPALGYAVTPRLEIPLGQMLTFNDNALGTQLLAKGWMPPEGWGTWTAYQDRPGVLYIPVAKNNVPTAIKLMFWGQLAPSFPEEHFTASINGLVKKELVVTLQDPIRTETIRLPTAVQAEIARSGMLRVEFMAPDGRSSHSMGLNQDDRVLGFGLRELTLLK